MLLATIEQPTDVGAVGPVDNAKVGGGGRANQNLARDFKMSATTSVDFPEHYIANIYLGQFAGL